MQPLSTKDTIYTKYDHAHICKLVIKADSIILIYNEFVRDFINTIVNNENAIWINTKRKSYINSKKTYYTKENLSDITSDKFGNKWYSSLENGLLVDLKNIFWQKSGSISNIRSGYSYNKNTIYGYQNGSLLVVQKNVASKFNVSNSCGAIERIIPLNDNYLFIIPSAGLYSVNIKKINFIK